MQRIMKFIVEKVVNGGRLGRLTEVGGQAAREVETPTCMLYTRAGKSDKRSSFRFSNIMKLRDKNVIYIIVA